MTGEGYRRNLILLEEFDERRKEMEQEILAVGQLSEGPIGRATKNDDDD